MGPRLWRPTPRAVGQVSSHSEEGLAVPDCKATGRALSLELALAEAYLLQGLFLSSEPKTLVELAHREPVHRP